MNYNSGEFKCPHCNNNKIEGYDEQLSTYQNHEEKYFKQFQYWINRKVFIKNELKTEWIFYKEKSKEWKCCLCCKNCDICYHCGKSLICCCSKGNADGTVICYPFSAIFYLLMCFWFDLFSFLSCRKKVYLGIKGKNTFNENYRKSPEINEKNIWDKIGGLTTEKMNDENKKG